MEEKKTECRGTAPGKTARPDPGRPKKDHPRIGPSQVDTLVETPFLNVYDLHFRPGRHYYTATRRRGPDITALKTDAEFLGMTADAVSCFLILEEAEKKPQLLLIEEFRYPVGQYLLSVPAGLIDPEDREGEEPALNAARREIREETGILLDAGDTLKLVNPLVFSTPGMTDESNALVCAVIRNPSKKHFTQSGAVGGEPFDGFVRVDEEKARELVRRGTDESGRFYPVYTWMALMYFLSGAWKESGTPGEKACSG